MDLVLNLGFGLFRVVLDVLLHRPEASHVALLASFLEEPSQLLVEQLQGHARQYTGVKEGMPKLTIEYDCPDLNSEVAQAPTVRVRIDGEQLALLQEVSFCANTQSTFPQVSLHHATFTDGVATPAAQAAVKRNADLLRRVENFVEITTSVLGVGIQLAAPDKAFDEPDVSEEPEAVAPETQAPPIVHDMIDGLAEGYEKTKSGLAKLSRTAAKGLRSKKDPDLANLAKLFEECADALTSEDAKGRESKDK